MTLITDGANRKRYNEGMEQAATPTSVHSVHSGSPASARSSRAGQSDMDRRKTALRRVQFLKHLPQDVIDTLAVMGHERILGRGEALFVERSRCLGLIVVLSGAVKVVKTDIRGRELTLDREMPGESVFELPLFDGGNYPAGAEGGEDDTHVYIVPPDKFRQVMADCPQIAAYALRALAVRQRKLIQMVEAHSLHSVRARLAAYLLQTAQVQAGQPQNEQRLAAPSFFEFELSETNEEIASRIGTVREVVSRTLHSFKDAGILRLNGRTVRICDSDTLRQAGGMEAEE